MLAVDAQWLGEFTCSFEQFVEGEDGDAVGRQVWAGRDDAWRAQRAADPRLGYEDALAEADAWDQA